MAILANNAKLIKVGQDYSAGSGISINDHTISVTGEFGKTYSAGDNVDIYEQGKQLYISSKDWTNYIANASANAYNEAVSQIPDPFDPSYISGQVDNKLDTTAFTSWQNGQYTTDLQTIEGQIANKQDSLTFAHGTSSGSVSSINGSAIVDDYTYNMLKVTRVATANLHRTLNSNSGTWNEVSAKVDTTALNSIVDSSTISYNAKPTNNPIYANENYLNNVNSIEGQNGLSIVPSNVLQVPNVITAAPNGVLQVPGVITANPDGIIASGLTAQNNYGLTANGITANSIFSGFSANGITAGKGGPLVIEGKYEKIDAYGGLGFTFSSQNTNFGTAQLTTAYGNQLVKVNAPKFEARNISGAGFSIEASGAKGYDESGNVVWDTQNPQVKNIISYGDTKTEKGGLNGNIILTVMPSVNASNLTSSPYVVMDASNASYFAAYGPSAHAPTVSLKPDTITFYNQGGTSGRATVGSYDIKQEYSGSSWTLTGSIQKREIEYDAGTSAITAIAGSAIGGGGVTGEFVPQSAFDELKASYDALSSLFATYSGQWLLPNEGV